MRLACAILLLWTLFGVTGCDIAGSDTAAAIVDDLKKLPGVQSASQELSTYSGGLTASALAVNVSTRPDVSGAELDWMWSTLVRRVTNANTLRDAKVDLTVLRGPRATAHVRIDPTNNNPAKPPWDEWVHVAADYPDAVIELIGTVPQGARYVLTLNAFAEPGPVTAPALANLTRRLLTDFDASRPINWEIKPIGDVKYQSIQANHGLPEASQLALWESLNQLAPTSGLFDMTSDSSRRNQFTIERLPAADQVDDIVGGQLQLIKDSGLRAEYRVHKERIVVRPGGCSKGISDEPTWASAQELQTGLRTQFETCSR